MITDFRKKKVCDYLKENHNGKVLLIFDHGLGDLINFFPIYDSLNKRYPNYRFDIGTPLRRNNSYLHRAIISLGDNFRDLISSYSYIFKIAYTEPTIEEKKNGIQKPYLCNIKEIGLPNFVWKPYIFDQNKEQNKELNRIGFHYTGDTNPGLKNINFKIVEKIWLELKENGYSPYEVHFNTKNTRNQDYPDFINEDNSSRFQRFDIRKLTDIINTCKYFIGIESGPLYLAYSLGKEVIGIENRMKIKWYSPIQIPIIDSNHYNNYDIFQYIKPLKNRNKLNGY